MSNNIDSKGVTISVKIYDRLLAAYPAEFRREYGAAMKQLFRDQCRDAWNRAQSRGLALLWLRVLLDWAKTSLVEHLLSLHRRESMCRKVLRAFGFFRVGPQFRASFIRMFAMLFVVAVVCSAIVANFSPRVYFSTAKLFVRTGEDPHRAFWKSGSNIVLRESKIIASFSVLSRVITKLNLQHLLASQAGEPDWTLAKTYDKLLQQIDVASMKNCDVITISVKNLDPNTAAQIANATTGAYREDFIDRMSKMSDHLLIVTPLLNAVPIEKARPDVNSYVRNTSHIFLMWIFGGTILALLAGGGGAWRAGHNAAR